MYLEEYVIIVWLKFFMKCNLLVFIVLKKEKRNYQSILLVANRWQQIFICTVADQSLRRKYYCEFILDGVYFAMDN